MSSKKETKLEKLEKRVAILEKALIHVAVEARIKLDDENLQVEYDKEQDRQKRAYPGDCVIL